jgi:hypothetical protein
VLLKFCTTVPGSDGSLKQLLTVESLSQDYLRVTEFKRFCSIEVSIKSRFFLRHVTGVTLKSPIHSHLAQSQAYTIMLPHIFRFMKHVWLSKSLAITPHPQGRYMVIAGMPRRSAS